ncbi:DUF6262 family protein [Streptomyces sp. NPDC006510]|uniref:DUF6262 family protein n=1 Tax=Streptomyces sp. NPDC006510 TaxID=3155600 RepID=UPI00339E0DC5
MTSTPISTAAAIAARRRQTQDKLAQVEKALGQLRRERGRLTIRAIAERAGVSATFLYENTAARSLVKNAVVDSRSRHDRRGQAEHERIEATCRERALNAEAELTQEHRTLQERLEGARSNLRFADKRIADLEVQLLEQGGS